MYSLRLTNSLLCKSVDKKGRKRKNQKDEVWDVGHEKSKEGRKGQRMKVASKTSSFEIWSLRQLISRKSQPVRENVSTEENEGRKGKYLQVLAIITIHLILDVKPSSPSFSIFLFSISSPLASWLRPTSTSTEKDRKYTKYETMTIHLPSFILIAKRARRRGWRERERETREESQERCGPLPPSPSQLISPLFILSWSVNLHWWRWKGEE